MNASELVTRLGAVDAALAEEVAALGSALEATQLRSAFPQNLSHEKKNVRFVTELARGIDWIVVDGRLLQALVSRLLSNAVKFTREGEIALRARLLGEASAAAGAAGVRAPEPSGDTLEIVVENTGSGIATEVRASRAAHLGLTPPSGRSKRP